MKDEKFWEIIKKLNWDGDYERCEKDLKNMIDKNIIKNPQQFYDTYKKYLDKINAETNRRIENEEDCFRVGVSYGSDDCHFMDLPAELIGRGKKEVTKYLKGSYKIPYETRECFTYMFQDIEDEGLIET